MLTAKVVPALAPIAIAPVSFRHNAQNTASTHEAAHAYSILDGDAPDITGRALNVLI